MWVLGGLLSLSPVDSLHLATGIFPSIPWNHLIPQCRQPSGFPVIWDQLSHQLPSVCPHTAHAGIHTGVLHQCASSTLSPSPSSGVIPHSSQLSLVPISKRNRKAPVLGLLLPSPLTATLQLNFGGWGDLQEGSAQPRGSTTLCCCEGTQRCRMAQSCKHDCKRHHS